MLLSEALNNKWGTILDHKEFPKITNDYRRAVTAIILENTSKELKSFNKNPMLMEDAPTNNVGDGNIASYDPILISMLRRSQPNLMAYDIAGVQPMRGPTGKIFCKYARYDSQTGTEALFNEADTVFTSSNKAGNTANVGSHTGSDPVANTADSSTYTTGIGMTTAQGEALGDSGANLFAEMAFSVDSVTVEARTRKLKAEYTVELAQDFKALHGLDLEQELANDLSMELLAEQNRELVRHIYRSATLGAQVGTQTAGVFNLDTDSNGRWSVEKFMGLRFQMEREANVIARATRRGKGNIAIVSADVASALSAGNILNYNAAMTNNLNVDDTGSTFVGTIGTGAFAMRVYIDPYFGGSLNGNELAVIGYKGSAPTDAGLFFCPYVPIQMMRAQGEQTFQPKIGFFTRYGLVANPYATSAGNGVVGDRNTSGQANIYYRIFKVTNI